MIMTQKEKFTIVTAGATYLDIDAYACAVAMAELLCLQGGNAVAFSAAPRNYSVCEALLREGQMAERLPEGYDGNTADYIIVDVSDPNYLEQSVPLERVVAVYDHHVGFETFWIDRIGENAKIEFIGAAATLVFREWKQAGLEARIKATTAKLLAAAILDNTLNLTSANTTAEDVDAFAELCGIAGVGDAFRGDYFSAVQETVEADLENALFGDVKTVRDNPVLPPRMGQVAVWDVKTLLDRIEEIRAWFDGRFDCWMLNIIDIQHNCNYFVCDSTEHQGKLEKVFDVHFEKGIAKTAVSYLRKEIIKKTVF